MQQARIDAGHTARNGVTYPTTTAPIAKGNRMPPYDGKAVTWQLIQHA